MRNDLRTQALVAFSLLCGLASFVRAEFPGAQPLPGVRYQAETRTDPPMRLFVVKVDLAKPGVKLHVSPGGPDPDGPGEWETTLMRPTEIADRDGFDLVVNGDFFTIKRDADDTTTHPATGPQPGYRRDVWAGAIGPAMSDGKTWSTSTSRRPCLVVRAKGKASIEEIAKPPKQAQAVIAGNVMLIDDGKVVPQKNKDRHPRTVVGVDREGKTLTILTVDGRWKGNSVGMSYEELAAEMLRLGCWDAINLDGGGSTVLAMRDPATGKLEILNRPSDGRERPVVNVLGVTVGDKPAKPKKAG